MDNIVFLIIAGIAFVVNTILNYNKEKKKNEQRNIQSPKKTTSQPRVQIPPSPPQPKKVKKQATPYIPAENIINIPEVKSTLESETMLLNNKYQSEENAYHILEDQSSVFAVDENDEIGNENKRTKRSSGIRLNTKDDLKKAIIYSTILERKY